MALCSSCGFYDEHCQCPRQISITRRPWFYYFVFTAGFFFTLLLFLGSQFLIIRTDSCYLELFANSVSVSNANATANWRIGFTARSPITGCKISLNTINSRLLRGGDEVIYNSSYSLIDSFGESLNGDKPVVVFDDVVMPKVTTGDVIWDFGVEIVSTVKTHLRLGNGFVMVTCPNIPVKFTTDPTGNLMGSLLGNMRRCDYKFRRFL